MDGSDTLYTISSAGLKTFKPIRPGMYTTSNAPSASIYEGYIIYNLDSNKHQYSDGSTWINMPGGGSGGGGLPTIPNGYPYISNGSGGGDSSIALYVNRSTKQIGFGTSSPTHALTLNKEFANSGLVLYNTSDQVTNYERLLMKTTSTNIAKFDLQHGGTGAVGYYSFEINGVPKFQSCVS